MGSMAADLFPFLLLVLAFFVGSFPTGYLIGRICGVDLRKSGSGNIGATNAARALGKKVGALTLTLDIAKGVLAAYLPRLILGEAAEPELSALCGFLAIVGHCFSPFMNFSGGKGVATTVGAFIVLAFWPMLIGVLLFLVVKKLFGYVSLGSIILVNALVLGIVVGLPTSYNRVTLIVAICVALLVMIRHSANIGRLIAGTEHH